MLRTLFVSTLAATLVTSCSMTPPKRMMDVQAGEKFVLKKATDDFKRPWPCFYSIWKRN